jgi:hypothetical protein
MATSVAGQQSRDCQTLAGEHDTDMTGAKLAVFAISKALSPEKLN